MSIYHEAPTEDNSPRRRICICTTTERETGRYFSACFAHPRLPADGICGHTAAEGCDGHGDF